MTNFIQQAEDRLFKHKPMEENKPIMETEVVEDAPEFEEPVVPEVTPETPVVEDAPVVNPALNCPDCKGSGLTADASARCSRCQGTGRV